MPKKTGREPPNKKWTGADKERLHRAYDLGFTIPEIAEKLGLSAERVSVLLGRPGKRRSSK